MIYRVELKKLRDTIENVKRNPDEAKRVTKIEAHGIWMRAMARSLRRKLALKKDEF